MKKINYQLMAEKYFAGLMREVDESGDYAVVVPIDDRWEFPLPTSISGLASSPGSQKIATMTISISNWARENSFYEYDTGELTVVTAFGDVENSAIFSSLEILALLDDTGQTIYVKPYFIQKKKKEEKDDPYTLKGLIDKHTISEKSMNAMKKNNPDLFKKK